MRLLFFHIFFVCISIPVIFLLITKVSLLPLPVVFLLEWFLVLLWLALAFPFGQQYIVHTHLVHRAFHPCPLVPIALSLSPFLARIHRKGSITIPFFYSNYGTQDNRPRQDTPLLSQAEVLLYISLLHTSNVISYTINETPAF